MRFTVVGALMLFFAVNASAQSLADIARKERHRQKGLQSKHTYSNAGQAVSTAAGSGGTSAARAGTASSEVAPFEVRDNQGHNEKYWRDKFDQARNEAKRADERIALLEQKVQDLNTQLLRQSDMYNRENRLGPEIETANKDLAAARRDAAQARQKISDMEEELRRAGGPAGWAR